MSEGQREMTMQEKLEDLIRAEQSQVLIFYMNYSKVWSVSFEQKLKGSEVKLEEKETRLEDAVRKLYSRVHTTAKYGIHSLLPTLLSYDDEEQVKQIIESPAQKLGFEDEVPY